MPTVVVAALSARQLAQSARHAGWDVIALDLFGDVDTQQAARRWSPIGTAETLRIDADRFLAALQVARALPDCIGWIAGAGFEPQPQLLEAGARLLPLIGNDPAVTQHVRDPRRFFAALDGLGIPHPLTVFKPPVDPSGWLVKDFASSGGWHVRRMSAAPAQPDSLPRIAEEGASSATNGGVHFQRETPGRPMSMLFLADGRRARPIAMNALRVRAVGARPFVYHGAIGPITDLPAHVPAALARAVAALADTFRLRGLGSLDVLLDGDAIYVVEVNPRPTATLALYDTDVPQGLLRLHAAACNGTLPAAPPPIDRSRVRGEATVFAPRRCRITPVEVVRLADLGCHDIPQPASDVPAGAPLCTVAAHDTSVAAVHEQLAARAAAVLAMVQNRNEVPKDAA